MGLPLTPGVVWCWLVVQKQLWEVEDVSYDQSHRLLQETEAAVWLLDNAGGAMDFSGLDTAAVRAQYDA
jgi:hypothetical protein